MLLDVCIGHSILQFPGELRQIVRAILLESRFHRSPDPGALDHFLKGSISHRVTGFAIDAAELRMKWVIVCGDGKASGRQTERVNK